MSWPTVDLTLARRLEHAEGAASAAFVDARARLVPAHGATWIAVDGVRAMFDGVGSPLTQTFGLGLDQPVGDATLTALERFFLDRGAAVDHEVSPLAEGEPLPLLTARGYVPIELTDVLCRPLTADDAIELPSPLAVAPIAPADGRAWAEAAADGWSETPEVVPFVRDLGGVYPHTAGATCYAAFDGDTIVAAGVLAAHAGVAVLAGASTRPAWRRRGAQAALLATRLRDAHRQGCDLAMICARPGSASHRNAQRRGFRVAYTRIKWHRPAEPSSPS
ncbi:MAG: GNAT family N-acetyltransferase [Vicinamibacterales bacterium]